MIHLTSDTTTPRDHVIRSNETHESLQQAERDRHDHSDTRSKTRCFKWETVFSSINHQRVAIVNLNDSDHWQCNYIQMINGWKWLITGTLGCEYQLAIISN